MNHADLSVIVLIGLFALATQPRMHLGLAAFPAAYLVSLVAGLPTEELVSFFPSSFVVLVLGVMFLFAVLQIVGAMDVLLDGLLTLVRGNPYFVPLVPFAMGVALTALGTLPLAAIAITMPVTMGLAQRYRLPSFLMAFVGLNGIVSGIFAPLSVFGVTARDSIADLGIATSGATSILVGLAALVVGSILTAAVMFVYRGALAEARRESLMVVPASVSGPGAATPASSDAGLSDSASSDPVVGWRVGLAFVGVAVVLVCALVFGLDLGYVAFTVAFALFVVFGLQPNDILNRVPWGVIVLIGGLLTYVGLMQELGAFARISELLTVGESPLVGLLVLCYLAAITSFFANSLAVIVTSMPLLPTLVEGGELNAVGAVIAVLLSCVVTDINPLGPTGGLALASTPEGDRQKMFRQLLGYGLAATFVATVVMWTIFGVVPTL